MDLYLEQYKNRCKQKAHCTCSTNFPASLIFPVLLCALWLNTEYNIMFNAFGQWQGTFLCCAVCNALSYSLQEVWTVLKMLLVFLHHCVYVPTMCGICANILKLPCFSRREAAKLYWSSNNNKKNNPLLKLNMFLTFYCIKENILPLL